MAFKLHNRWRHGKTRFDLPPLDLMVGPQDGLFPLRVILDPAVGEEVVLLLRDQTPFMEQLRQVRPFQLMLKTGVARTDWGPVGFLVFWVPDPADSSQYTLALDVYVNPHSEEQIALWRTLAGQSHWHLFLVGAGNTQRGFFEFENTFELADAINTMETACADIQLLDFFRAKAEFMRQYTVEDLFAMGE